MTQKMTPDLRRDILKKYGITQKSIAIEQGVSEMSVSREINDVYTSHKIRCAIAKAMKMPLKQVFPKYYCRPPQRSTSKTANMLAKWIA